MLYVANYLCIHKFGEVDNILGGELGEAVQAGHHQVGRLQNTATLKQSN